MRRIVETTDNTVTLSEIKNADHIGIIYKGSKYAIATKPVGPSNATEPKYKYHKLNRKMNIGLAEYTSKKALVKDHNTGTSQAFVFDKSSELMDWLLMPITK